MYTLQMLTDHSAGNLVGKGDQMNWPQLSQGSVWLFVWGGDLWEWRGWADTTITKQGQSEAGVMGVMALGPWLTYSLPWCWMLSGGALLVPLFAFEQNGSRVLHTVGSLYKDA